MGSRPITDYKPPPQTCDSNTSLLNDLNSFFARFDTHNSMPTQKTTASPRPDPVPECSQREENPFQDQPPQGIRSRPHPWSCAEGLCTQAQHNASLSQAVVPLASKPPPSYLLQRSPHYPLSMTIVPLH